MYPLFYLIIGIITLSILSNLSSFHLWPTNDFNSFSKSYFSSQFSSIFGQRYFIMRPSTASIILFIFSLSLQSLANEINVFFPEERDALRQLRDVVNSSINLHANWTGPPCNDMNKSRWAGIVCSNWHITHLVLEGIRLSGSLPPTFLQNLTFLSKLSFKNNSLHGPLPALTNLTNLKSVFLSGNQFSGSIPTAYIDLPRLTELELQENEISGSIPPFDQQSLIAFNVSHNRLGGPVPETPVLQRFSKSSYDDNPGLCGGIPGLSPCPIIVPPPVPGVPSAPSPSPVPSRDKGRGGRLEVWTIGVIAAAAAIVPISAILIFFCCYRRIHRKKKKQESDQPGEVSIDRRGKQQQWSESGDDPERTLELEFLGMKPGLFDLDDLLRAAAQVLGKGQVGTTYKAMLESGSVVAVKRFKQVNSALSKKEYVHQMHLLGNIKHENLTEMVSFYHSRDEKFILYDYVQGGSLFTLLHENRGIGRMPLDWNSRVSIIKDIAKGLSVLHHRLNSQKVPHGNLKSSNVLIHSSDNIRAKLTDYGFLPLVPANKLAVKRTPEFRQRKKLTSKSDIYCFGILVLEIITGKVPASSGGGSGSEEGEEEGDTDLSGWVRAAVNLDWSTDILDVEILGEKEGYDEMLKLAEIALECTDEAPEKRPGISQVLSRIQDMRSAVSVDT